MHKNNMGMTRPLDRLGRLVLPIELRRQFHINEGDRLSILADGAGILLQPLRVSCTFCEGTDGLTEYMGKKICAACLQKLK